MKSGGHSIYAFAISVSLALLGTGCAESSGGGSKKARNSGTGTGVGANASGDELCQSISQQPIASDPNFQDFIAELCGGYINTLRSPDYQYRGMGKPNIQPQAVQKGNQSQMRLFASMAAPIDAKSYFNLMRLQSFRPEDFRNEGFDYDRAIKYEVLGSAGTSVSYHYTNRKEDVAVEYNATSVFIEAIPDKLYIITSTLDKSLGIVKTFRGMQIVYQNAGAAGTYTEVFSMSDQLYDNNDDHQATVSKAQNEFVQDMARGFRNSSQAQKANQYFFQ